MKNRINVSGYASFAALAFSCALVASCSSSGADDELPPEEAPPAEQVTGSAPVIFGDPETSLMAGTQYLFVPEASDADGDILTFSIVNRPAWAEFDTTTGELQGIPRQDDVGEYPEIVISVTDDDSIVSLPAYTITVTTSPQDDSPQDDDSGSSASGVPAISGEPNQFVVAGTTYAFQPVATDPEDDALSWSIVNKPAWATFDTMTGRLEGEPAAADVGQGEPIELSVSDGSSVAALPPFTITVEAAGSASYTLSWIAPTENEDGTPLTDLAGYRIYYGMVSGDYTETVILDSPGLTSYVLDRLAPGQYFLVMTAIDGTAQESRYTPELALVPTG